MKKCLLILFALSGLSTIAFAAVPPQCLNVFYYNLTSQVGTISNPSLSFKNCTGLSTSTPHALSDKSTAYSLGQISLNNKNNNNCEITLTSNYKAGGTVNTHTKVCTFSLSSSTNNWTAATTPQTASGVTCMVAISGMQSPAATITKETSNSACVDLQLESQTLSSGSGHAL